MEKPVKLKPSRRYTIQEELAALVPKKRNESAINSAAKVFTTLNRQGIHVSAYIYANNTFYIGVPSPYQITTKSLDLVTIQQEFIELAIDDEEFKNEVTSYVKSVLDKGTEINHEA